MNNALRLVVDHEHNTACDWCGDHIKAGEQHYVSDHTILCSICGVSRKEEANDRRIPSRLP